MTQWISRINLRRVIPGLFAVAALLFFAHQVTAQEGTILGTVSDPTGAVVANASINIVNVETGLSSVVVSDGAGQYVAPDLAIGHYNIKVTATGFKAVEKTGVTLQVGDRLRLDFALQIGAQTQTVTVEAEALHLQTDTGEVSNMITGTDIAKLEMNGRSLVSMEAMVPGAVSMQGSQQVPSSQGSDAAVEFNGQRVSHNLWLFDGGEAADRGGGGAPIVSPSLEAIAEARTMTSNYSAEYGLSSGGTISTTLKSGSRQFHGEGWEFFRNDYLNAKNYFSPGKTPELRYNIFGANIGGPVSFHPNRSEPKTFFFYNQEWRRFVNSNGVINQLVPLTSSYQGNFAGVTDSKGNPIIPGVPCASTLSASQQARFTGAGITTFSTTNEDGSCAYDVHFPNNTIPSALLNDQYGKNAQTLLTQGKIFPAPNKGNYFNLPVSEPNIITEELARVDHKFNDKFSVFGHWVSEQTTQGYATVMWSGDNVPTIGNTFGNPAYSAVIHTTYTINPNLVNEAYFNYDSNQIHILPKSAFGSPLASPDPALTANRVFAAGGSNKVPDNVMPSIALQKQTGSNYSPNWSPWNNVAKDYSVHDDVSWVRGAHQFKFGGSWALFSKTQDAFAPLEGNFGFNGYYTGYDFADFLLGLAQNYNESALHQAGIWNNVSPALYFADNWRATPRLTVNLGLRWDGIPHAYEKNDQTSSFYPNLYNPSNAAVFADPTKGTSISASSPGLVQGKGTVLSNTKFYTNGIGIGGVTPGVPRGLANDQWNCWGPRLGFSYDLTGQGRTVVRGGFGVMYERVQGNDMYNQALNVPANASVNFNNVLLSNPQTSVQTGQTLQAPIIVASIQGVQQDNYKPPTTTQYSAGIQHQLNPGTIFDLSYVGTLLRHQSDDRDINLPPVSALPGLIASSSNYNTYLPYKGFAGIKMYQNEANGIYNGLQMSVHLNIHQDLQAQFGYTYSHAYDTSQSNGNGFDLDNVSNPYTGWKADWGPSIFDRHQVAFLEYEWNMPFFRHSTDLASKILGGWELAGSSIFEGGGPLNITLGGNQGSNGLQNGTNRPNLLGTVSYPRTRIANSSNIQWFSPGYGLNNPTFGTPAPGQWGNIPFDALRGPGSQNWNIAVHKIFRFTEHSNVELRAETFNIFNHPQWVANGNQGGIGTNLNGGNFGVITSAADPREFQLAGKINF